MIPDLSSIPPSAALDAPAAIAIPTAQNDQTLAALQRFYGILTDLEARIGGPSYLRDGLPPVLGRSKGVYVFFEDGERRAGSGEGPRVVRVGTHGLTMGSGSTLRSRLNSHRGTAIGGNQRASIFRRHIGAALMAAGRVPGVAGW